VKPDGPRLFHAFGLPLTLPDAELPATPPQHLTVSRTI